MRFTKTQVLAIGNEKGGCGKTTASVSLASAFARLGYAVCLVDTDPQANASTGLGIKQDWLRETQRRTVADVFLAKTPASEVTIPIDAESGVGRVDLVPGNKGLFVLEKRLESQLHETLGRDDPALLAQDKVRNEQRHRLARSIDSLRGQYDLVIIDTPPSLGFLMTTSLIAADWLIIPVLPSMYDMEGLQQVVETVRGVRKQYNPRLTLAGVLLGGFDKRTKLHRQVHDLLVDMFGEKLVFKTTIGQSVRFQEATFKGQSIFTYAPDEPAAAHYLSLAEELLARGSKVHDAGPPTSGAGELGQRAEVAHG